MRVFQVVLPLILSFALFCSSSRGEVETQDTVTRFETLMRLYETKGKLPPLEALMGARSGRAYYRAFPDETQGAFSFCDRYSDGGPLFPNSFLGCFVDFVSIPRFFERFDYDDAKFYVDNQPLQGKVHTEEEALCFSNLQQTRQRVKGKICFRVLDSYLIFLAYEHGSVALAGYLFTQLR